LNLLTQEQKYTSKPDVSGLVKYMPQKKIDFKAKLFYILSIT